MCVSGLPKRNGNEHARQIGRLALSMVEAAKSFKIPHMQSEDMKIRIGMNSGSVMAGVIGIAMPRFFKI